MLRIRTMKLDDVPSGCRLSDAAGWNQLPADWQRLLALEPEGCFVAEEDGQPVGTTCITRFETIAWVSMVLVDAAHRGRGIGTQLVRHALDWLDRCGTPTVRLDATELGRTVYEKLGFRCEYEVARWEGMAAGGELSLEVTLAADSHLEAIAALDEEATGTPRRNLLARLLAEQPAGTRAAMNGQRVAGYSGCRLGRIAWQVGPVVASESSSGAALLDAAFFEHQGQAVFLDVPVINRPATRWVQGRGLRLQRQFIRMVRGRPVVDRPERIWAGFGPEKG